MPQNLMPFKRPPPFFGTWEDMRVVRDYLYQKYMYNLLINH